MGKEIGSLTAASTLTRAELLHVIQGAILVRPRSQPWAHGYWPEAGTSQPA